MDSGSIYTKGGSAAECGDATNHAELRRDRDLGGPGVSARTGTVRCQNSEMDSETGAA